MQHAQNFACPRCGQVAPVAKVSALVAGGTSAGVFAGPTSGVGYTYGNQGGYTTLAGVSQTALSQKLSPPVRPFYDNPYGTGTKISIVLLGLLTITSLYFLVSLPLAQGVWLGMPGLIFYGGILAWILIYKSNAAKKRHAQVDAAMPGYKVACRRWDELYYCQLNDVVFVPGKPGACVPSSEMSRLLH